MKADLHVHSNYSEDGRLSPEEILRLLKSRGIKAVAITDHNSVRGSLEASKIAQEHGMIVVRGTEVSSTIGHIAALGIDQDIPRGLTPSETVERIHASGGIAVAVHPFRFSTGLGANFVRSCKFDAVEVLNGWTTKKRNRKALEIANELNLPKTAGSDGHREYDIGKTFVVIDDCENEAQIIDQILKGKAVPGGESRSATDLVKDAIGMTMDWARRGFKRL